MTDIQSEKWLWVKGGLFVVLGVLSSGLLIARNPEFSTCVLLGIAVWAFCRAYYFAFYVIQHYVDPSFRFAGLFAFWDYVIDRTEGASSPDVPRRHSSEPAARVVYGIKTFVLQWMAFGMLAFFVLPEVLASIGNTIQQTPYRDWMPCLTLLVISIAAAPFFALGAMASLAEWPVRYRVPVAVALVVFLSVSLCLGFGTRSGMIRLAIGILFPLVVALTAFLLGSIQRWIRGWRLVVNADAGPVQGSESARDSWGVGYLFFLCLLVAVVVATLRAVLAADSLAAFAFLREPEILWSILAIVILCMLGMGLVASVMPEKFTHRHRWTSLASVTAILVGPIVVVSMLGWFFNGTSLGDGIIEGAYAAEFGFVGGLVILLLSTRSVGVRLVVGERNW